MKSGVQYKLEQDLRFSQRGFVNWGRQIIRAIDFDDCITLVDVFIEKPHLGALVDTVATAEEYGGHIWTAYMHRFVGDTALHMAIRQMKIKCVYMLLALGASGDIENAKGETPDDLAQLHLGETIHELQKKAFREVLPLVDPTVFSHLPAKSPLTHVNFPSIEREAWKLMER